MTAAIAEWLPEQLKLVEENGRAPRSLVLEGPDGRPWGTWAVANDETLDKAQGSLRVLEGTLPAGGHSARWVILDAEGTQFACLPTILRGRSSDASAAAKDAQSFARATSIQLQAAEHLAQIQKNMLDRVSKQLEETSENMYQLQETLAGIVNANAEAEERKQKFEAGEKRLDEVLQSVKPMFEAAAEIGAEKFLRWASAEEVKKRATAKKRKRRSKALPGRSQGDGPNKPPPPVAPRDATRGRPKARTRPASKSGTAGRGRAASVARKPVDRKVTKKKAAKKTAKRR